MSTDLVKVVDINAQVFKLRQTWHIAVRCYITIRLVSADGGVGVMGGWGVGGARSCRAGGQH